MIILDRAAWHTTKRLKKFNNITIMPLPTASPELNPTEQVWQALRDGDYQARADWIRTMDAWYWDIKDLWLTLSLSHNKPDWSKEANIRIRFEDSANEDIYHHLIETNPTISFELE